MFYRTQWCCGRDGVSNHLRHICSDTDQRKQQSSASLAFAREIRSAVAGEFQNHAWNCSHNGRTLMQCEIRKQSSYFAKNLTTTKVVILFLVNTVCDCKFKVLMQSMSHCHNKTVIKQLCKRFQQQRINTVTTMVAIRIGCFVIYDVKNKTIEQWLPFLVG